MVRYLEEFSPISGLVKVKGKPLSPEVQ